MPLTAPTQTAASTQTAVGLTTTIATTLIAGSTHILGIGTQTTAKTVASVTDDLGGNTWTVDKTVGLGNAVSNIISCKAATGGTATLTVTFNDGTSTNIQYMVFIQSQLTGLVDKTSSGSGTSSSSSSGSTGTLTSADQVAFGFTASSASMISWAHGTGWSDPTTKTVGPLRFACEIQVVTATTALTADGTLGGTPAWAAAVATYPGSIALPSTFTFGAVHDVFEIID